MKKLFSLLIFVVATQLSVSSNAQPVTLAEVNKLMDFAEMLDPVLFAPPAQTQQLNEAGSDWHFRFFASSGLYVAVNINGTGPFLAGDVYALGGPYGNEPVRIDSLANLIAFIDSLNPGPPVTLADANKLFNFAQTAEPDLFSPATETQQVNSQGSTWLVRSYANTQVSIKINTYSTGTFVAGNVYIVGGPYGETEVFVDTLANLLAFIDSLGGNTDDDEDGVVNDLDQCPNTPFGEAVDAQGCSNTQLDDDSDGVNNALDQCPNTPAGEAVDASGCSNTQADGDNDGVNNALDQCPLTPPGESVDAQGCSNSQLDDDNDGVSNGLDQCPDTPAGEAVYAQGCSSTQLDDDNDGVSNALDQCPDTPAGEAVNADGCSNTQLDDDNDGVSNAADVCPDTPPGEPVNANGCSAAQADVDGDGVNNNLDVCPDTPPGEPVNANGCSAAQADVDGDGVNNNLDLCPNTPAGEAVNANGCSSSQTGGGPGDVQYIVNEGNGNCFPIVAPQVGTIAVFRTTTETEEGDNIFEKTEEWLDVSSTEITTRSTQTVVTGPVTSETVSVTTEYFDFTGGLIFLTEKFVAMTTTSTATGLPIPIPPTVTLLDTTTVFDPMLFVGPQDAYCEGMILYHPSVNQTITFLPNPQMSGPILAQSGENTVTVLAIDEEIDVEAGSFTTIHIRSVDEEGTADSWLDRDTGILVKNEVRNSDSEVIIVTELISLD